MQASPAYLTHAHPIRLPARISVPGLWSIRMGLGRSGPALRPGSAERGDRGSAARAQPAVCRLRGRSAMTVAIAWGDLATAYVSTGIPNIEIYASMSLAAAIASRALNWARPLLAWAPVQELLRRLADRSTGPSEEMRRTEKSRFWGEVRNSAGERRTARLETANGYRLTADGMIMAVNFCWSARRSGGYYTSSMLMGARCVEQLPGSTSIRVD